MNNNPRELYRKFCIQSYNNAIRFIDEADLLFKRKSFGHSYSLAVLGFEEWVKSNLAFLLLIGLSKPTDEDIQEGLRDHVWKHAIGLESFYFLLIIDWGQKTKYKHEVNQLTNKLEKKVISIKRFEKEILKIITYEKSDESENLRQFVEIIQKYNADNYIIENQKQEGFYVDINFKNNFITVPNDLKKINLKDTLFTYRIIIESYSEIISALKDRKAQNKKIKSLYKLGKLLRNAFEEK